MPTTPAAASSTISEVTHLARAMKAPWIRDSAAALAERARVMLALVLVSDEQLRAALVGLTFFRGRYNTDWTLLAGSSLIVAAPVVLVYISV